MTTFVSGMPKVSVAPDRVSVRPGETVNVEVTIQNTSQAVEHYGAAIVGLPRDDLFSCAPSVVKLRPGESGNLQVTINIPERPAPDAGLYTLGVLVRSPYQRQVSRCEELRMEVQPAPAVTVEAQPDVVSGGPDGSYTLRVANDGNTVLAVTLTGSDQERKVTFAFRPRSIQIAPNSSAPATLTVRARAPWTGQEVRRPLTVRASAGPDLAVERNVTFVQKPRVPGGPMKVAGLATAVLVLAGATIGGAVLSKQHFDPNKANAAATPTAAVAATGVAVVPANPAASNAAAASAAASRAGATAGGPNAGKASASPSGGGGNGRATIIDFSVQPNGQPAGDQVISGSAYAAMGVTLVSSVQFAPPECRSATGLALRTVTGVGSFLTSASPANAAACNTLPVKFTLAAPAKSVKLMYVPNGTLYTMRVQLADGTLWDVRATAPTGQLATMPYDAPPNAPILSVQFGHGSTDPNDKNPTIITQFSYIPA